jgi:diguanylate cyclase (GGDEF)-like protein/PAS domain S-box-containing protein
MSRVSAEVRRGVLLGTLALLPVAVLAASSILLASNQMTRVVDRQVRTTATVSSVVIGQQTDDLMALVHRYSTGQALVTELSKGRVGDATVADTLRNLATSLPGISASFVADVHGTSLATYPFIATATGQNFAYRDWYRGLVASGRPYVSDAIQTKDDNHTLAVTVTDYVRDAQGKPIAIIGLNYSLQSINSFADRVGHAQGITLKVTDRIGTSLTEAGAGGLVSRASDPRVRKAQAGRTGLMEFAPALPGGKRGPEEISAYNPVPGTDWTVVASKDKDVAFEALVQLRHTVLGIALLLMLILLGGVAVILRSDRRRRDSELLAESRDRELARVLEATDEGLISFDPLGTITGWNAQAEAIFGWSEQEVLGHNALDTVFDTQQGERYSHDLAGYLAGATSDIVGKRTEVTAQHKDGHAVSLEVGVWANDDGGGFSALVHDITERVTIRNALEMQRLMLIEADKATSLANTFFDAVLAATPDFTFVYDIATSAVLYASRDDEALGTDAHSPAAMGRAGQAMLIHPDDRQRLAEVSDGANELEDGQVLQVRYRIQTISGSWSWLSRRITPFRRDTDGAVVEVLGVIRDVTEATEFEDRLTHAALHDDLTGLPNRALLLDRLEAALVRSERDGREVAVLFCDLDGFKRVNDTAGHAAGDGVLTQFAQRLQGVVREHDTVARVGGDEFVIIVEPWDRLDTFVPAAKIDTAADRGIAVRLAERVRAALAAPVDVNGVAHRLSASIGVTYAGFGAGGTATTTSAEQVLQDADVAMYFAKDRGKDRVERFDNVPPRGHPESWEINQLS